MYKYCAKSVVHCMFSSHSVLLLSSNYVSLLFLGTFLSVSVCLNFMDQTSMPNYSPNYVFNLLLHANKYGHTKHNQHNIISVTNQEFSRKCPVLPVVLLTYSCHLIIITIFTLFIKNDHFKSKTIPYDFVVLQY